MIPRGVEVFVGLEPIDLRWSFDRKRARRTGSAERRALRLFRQTPGPRFIVHPSFRRPASGASSCVEDSLRCEDAVRRSPAPLSGPRPMRARRRGSARELRA